jgi:hypothetical protein
MLLELGPVPAGDVQQWARFARRMVCELRVDPADLAGVATPDFLDRWDVLIDRWESDAAVSNHEFRWSESFDPELAEYLLHGIERCLRSPILTERATAIERVANGPFMMHVVQSFVDGLSAEGCCSEQLCDHVRASLGAALDH